MSFCIWNFFYWAIQLKTAICTKINAVYNAATIHPIANMNPNANTRTYWLLYALVIYIVEYQKWADCTHVLSMDQIY